MKRLLIALLALSIALVAAVFGFILWRDPGVRQWLKPDYGPTLLNKERECHPQWERTEIADTGFYAFVAANTYRDEEDNVPDVLQIRVTYKEAEREYVYCYTREFALNKIPEGSWSTDLSTILDYNERTRAVSFQVGNESYQYVLPQPDQ